MCLLPVFYHEVSSIVNVPQHIVLKVVGMPVQRAVERHHRRSACVEQGQAAKEKPSKMPSHALCPTVRAGNLGEGQSAADWI